MGKKIKFYANKISLSEPMGLKPNSDNLLLVFISCLTIEKQKLKSNVKLYWSIITPDRRQSKTSILSRNVDQKSIATVFSIAICRPIGDKWQSKTLFLSFFDPRSSIVDNVFDCHLPGVIMTLSLKEDSVCLHT